MADKQEKKTTKKLTLDLPYNEELEKETLGIIMNEKNYSILNDIFSQLSKKYFYIFRNQIVYQELNHRFNLGLPCDMVSLSSAMTTDTLDKIGGIKYLADIQRYAISSAVFQSHIDQLKELYRNRSLITLANAVSDKAYNKDSSKTTLTYIERIVQDIQSEVDEQGFSTLSEVYQQVMDDIIDRYKNPLLDTSLKTGFNILDTNLNGGFRPSQMIVLAARPGEGKTTFAMQVVANIAKNNPEKVIAVFNLEMAKAEIGKRLLSTYSMINASNILQANISKEDLEKLVAQKEIFAKSHVHIEDKASLSASEIYSKARKLKYDNDGKLDLVVIDHMQLISQEKDLNRNQSRYELTTEVSRMMKIMAKELQVPVLVLSQMSRNIDRPGEKDTGPKRPKLSDLRESGAIEQDADIVLFLSKGDGALDNKEEEIRHSILIIEKNRSGINNIDIQMAWYKSLMYFEERLYVPREDTQQEDKEVKKIENNIEQESFSQLSDYDAPDEMDTSFLPPIGDVE